jgi:hypothetical protein
VSDIWVLHESVVLHGEGSGRRAKWEAGQPKHGHSAPSDTGWAFPDGVSGQPVTPTATGKRFALEKGACVVSSGHPMKKVLALGRSRGRI